MSSRDPDIHSSFVNALRTQAKTVERRPSDSLPCPYCEHQGRIFQTLDQLFSHAKVEHASDLPSMDPSRARAHLKAAALEKASQDQSQYATATTGSTPDVGALSLIDAAKGRQSPHSGKKRHAETELHARRGKLQSSVDVYDVDYSREMPYSMAPSDPHTAKKKERLLFDPAKSITRQTTSQQATPEPPSEWSVEANRSQLRSATSTHSAGRRTPVARSQSPQIGVGAPRKPGIIELPPDTRYPNLKLQPESRPISQEQLASEVKSIYAGLTMIETKCMQVDRAQHTATEEDVDSKNTFSSEHWQALIALHRSLLHEHHDFFLASQHPSASPGLKRLASNYSMPARMWKHGIHAFLEVLRHRLPGSIDHMLAYIYLAYQMMALLYETVPAFEDTWIECLGDLGRYRMAIEDEDIRDRETWAGVARSWYSKAADRNPTVGRLYHHLAILARPNALQQLYFYARSLACVRPFSSARESIMTLLDPILGRSKASYSHALPIDNSFILAHGILFEKLTPEDFEDARLAFLSQLDNHIGRVTAKWKEQGVYIAVTNIAGMLDYGADDSTLRQVLLLHYRDSQQAKSLGRPASPSNEEAIHTTAEQNSILPSITEAEVPSKLDELSSDFTFSRAYLLTMSTFSYALRRAGDKNVLPHVHVLLSFIHALASIPNVSRLVDHAPWQEIASFLNTLSKSERAEQLLPGPLFPSVQSDDLPLPEDYLIRGQLWSQWYFPDDWFSREHDEEDRYLEPASTIKSRADRVLRLGYHITKLTHWMSYDVQSHTFIANNAEDSS
ncbi:hypothetical protein M011DRAFT_411394 [Sporormia fimetaria CBS 119925]|uniref:DNA/RNA-binding domain-containing protein n=1 Tax=Sporormia fimetaria CBS 119925 TaxID=1340428 RepID=A0A6A6UXY8_9PLEO|nr:hypothetical protein M011DRAFT_411394 [Sporormia fimetaria CBS 119925]